MRDFDIYLEAEEGTIEGDDYYFAESKTLSRLNRAYDPFDLKGVIKPDLEDGDAEGRCIFRSKYLKYVDEHQAVMRKRAPSERVLPASVVECAKPSFLTYICKYVLKQFKHSVVLLI